jgi:hypothetical protein
MYEFKNELDNFEEKCAKSLQIILSARPDPDQVPVLAESGLTALVCVVWLTLN